MLGEELAVDVRDLAHEDGVGLVGTSGKSTARRRGKRAAASSTRRPHERIRELGPGDADLEVLERLEPAAEAGDEHLEHPSQPSTSPASGPAWS